MCLSQKMIDCFIFYLRAVSREETRPNPMHFSKCGAYLDATTALLQLGHSNAFIALISGT
jgi:hypothetical protein